MKKKAWESISSLFSIKLNEDEKFLYSNIRETRHREKFLEIKRVLHVTCLYLSLPLYLFFWICDLIFSPDNAELFLYLRLSIVPVGLLINYINHKVKTFLQAQWNALAFAFYNGLLITIMIFIMGDAANPYYAGLNLVAVGALSFAPWQRSLMWAPYVAVFAPYYSLFFILNDQTNPRLFLTNSFFIVGTVTISTVVRLFNEKLRWEEVKSRVLLNNEIQSRNEVIDKKTKEAVSLTYLSRQFSPQVVSAIKSGEIKLDDQVHRSKICAIFIDIVNSTERVTRLDKDKVNKAAENDFDLQQVIKGINNITSQKAENNKDVLQSFGKNYKAQIEKLIKVN